MRIRSARRMRIGHAGRYSPGGMAGAHRSHVAGREAGDASARGYSQLRRAIATGQSCRRSRPLRLHVEQFAVRIARDTDGHAGHIVGDVERMFALARLRCAIGCGLGLVCGGMHIQPSAIGGGCSRVPLQLLLHSIC